jgi:DNA-binding phage protein
MGKEFYCEVLKRIKLQNSTLTNFAKEIGVQRTHLAKALKGYWRGPRASEIVLIVCKRVYLQPPVECLEPQEAQA